MSPDLHIVAFWCWYRGQDFHGFQQQGALRTVQAELLRAFPEVGLERNPVVAGRTDRGVGAVANHQHFGEFDLGACVARQLFNRQDVVGGHAVLLTAGLDDCEHILSFHVRAGSLPLRARPSFCQSLRMERHWRPAGLVGSCRHDPREARKYGTKNHRRGTGQTYATAPCAIGEPMKTVKGISVTMTNR